MCFPPQDLFLTPHTAFSLLFCLYSPIDSKVLEGRNYVNQSLPLTSNPCHHTHMQLIHGYCQLHEDGGSKLFLKRRILCQFEVIPSVPQVGAGQLSLPHPLISHQGVSLTSQLVRLIAYSQALHQGQKVIQMPISK